MPLRKKKLEPEAEPERRHEHKGEAGGDESNWLVSYADMMTLLCGFFIMMFSMAKLDTPKYESLKREVAKAFGGEYEIPDSKKMAPFLTQILEESGVTKKDAVIVSDPSGLSITFHSTVFFDTLSADVKPEGQAILSKLIDAISTRQKATNKQYKIVVEGHTDSRPITGGAFPSNWELSGSRAARVIRMFLDKGYAPDHLTAIGYGDTRPEVQARTPAGTLDDAALARNRRVVIRVLDPQVDAIPYPDAPQEGAAPPQASAAEPTGSPMNH